MRATRKRKISLLGLFKRPSLILPTLMAWATKHPRQKPNIKWSSNSLTYNLFRVWELIFWRRYGIRPEMSTIVDKEGNADYHFHSKEAIVVFAEDWVKNLLKFKVSIPIQIWIPKMRFDWLNDLTIALSPIPVLVGVPQGPICDGRPVVSPHVLFAIGFDASSHYTVLTGSSQTIAHTVTGSNMLLWTYVWQGTATDKFSSLTYAASAYATLIYNNLNYDSTHRAYFGYKAGPATGTNNIVLTLNTSGDTSMASASYSGCAQTGIPDSSAFDAGDGSSNNYTQNTTVVASGCWLVGASTGRDGTCTGITAGARRETSNPNLYDSNTTVGTGTQGLSPTGCGNRVESKAIASFNPPLDPTISVSDSITITESVTMEETSFISVFDALTITESVSLDIANNISVSDLLTITESVTITNATLGDISVNDALSITESVTMSNPNLGDISVNDALSITESLQLEMNSLINVSDDISILESVQMEVNFFISVNDTISITTTLVDIFKIDFPAGVSHMRSLANNRPYGMDTRETYRMKSNQQNRPLGMDDQTII